MIRWPKFGVTPPPKVVLSLPHIKRSMDRISRFLDKRNVKTLFKTFKMIKKLYRFLKDNMDPMLGSGVYQIPCLCGKNYIGQTSSSFKACLKEHIVNITHNWVLKSTLVEHSKTKHLDINFNHNNTLSHAISIPPTSFLKPSRSKSNQITSIKMSAISWVTLENPLSTTIYIAYIVFLWFFYSLSSPSIPF